MTLFLASAQRSRQFCLLLMMVSSLALQLLPIREAGAQEPLDAAEILASQTLPVPDGLNLCPPDSPIASMLAQAVGKAGEVSACFVSRDNVRLPAVPQAIDYPVEYAFAIRLAVQPTGPYTKQDIEINLSQVKEKWKAFAPLAEQSKSEYEKRITDLLKAIGTEPLRITDRRKPTPAKTRARRSCESPHIFTERIDCPPMSWAVSR